MVNRALHQTLVVMRKELKDSLRDRRALFSIAFSIVIGPVLVGFMMNRIADRQREAEHVEIPVVGQEHAPALVDWLRQQSGVTVTDGPQRPEQAVRDRANDVVVVIAGRLRREIPRVAAGDRQGHCGYVAQCGAASRSSACDGCCSDTAPRLAPCG